jgi:hypothetical protein
MKKRTGVFFFLNCLGIAIIAAILHHYSFEIYTRYWHIVHKGSIHWYDLEIKVPENLVSRIIENTNGSSEIQIYQLANPNEVDILFERVSYHRKEGFKFQNKYECAGYRIIQMKPHRIMRDECVWVRARKEGTNPIYSEDVFFLSRDIRISFMGSINSRRYFEEVMDSLKIKDSPLDTF